ncbi:MAG: hypothetical protein KDI30_00130 [Pseudomonadales bacterium]|nr:hypothetical protein [Pseudomonadales bacterium]
MATLRDKGINEVLSLQADYGAGGCLWILKDDAYRDFSQIDWTKMLAGDPQGFGLGPNAIMAGWDMEPSGYCSQTFFEQLVAWVLSYDTAAARVQFGEDLSLSFPDDWCWHTFNQEGLRLARLLRAEKGPEVLVRYWTADCDTTRPGRLIDVFPHEQHLLYTEDVIGEADSE